MPKKRLLYYIHHHGKGHLQVFRLLLPELKKWFDVHVIVASETLHREVRRVHTDVSLLPSKWPPDMHGFTHTFSKAFEGVPYASAPATRSAYLSTLLLALKPAAFFCDGSAELAIMARSMGTPVIFNRLLGRISNDPTQVFAYQLADHITAFFPKKIEQPDYPYVSKTVHFGFLAKYAPHPPSGSKSTVIILLGSNAFSLATLRAMTSDPRFRYQIIGNTKHLDLPSAIIQEGHVNDIQPAIRGQIVVSAAGLNSISELIALRKKLILLPEPRPYDEQAVTAAQLSAAGGCLVAGANFAASEWSALFDDALQYSYSYSDMSTPAAPKKIAQQIGEWYG